MIQSYYSGGVSTLVDSLCLEVLMHNVSHSDLVFVLRNGQEKVIARPRFSYFRPISEKILQITQLNHSKIPIAFHPLHRRNDPQQVHTGEIPFGFDLSECPLHLENNQSLRFRTVEDMNIFDNKECIIEYVYFPLLSVLINKWHNMISEDTNRYIPHLILVSGVGTPPRDEESPFSDNSTEYTAKLMKFWLQLLWPKLIVHTIHTNTNLFRYDDNIGFVQLELMPKLDDIRDDCLLIRKASRQSGDWREYMRVTSAFADGASARVSAINAALGPYRPTYMHFWQLKTFWHQRKVCLDDVYIHTFEDFATRPAIPVRDVKFPLRLLVDEIIEFKKEFDEVTARSEEDGHDLSSFWMRKTKKPVLAVLLVGPLPPTTTATFTSSSSNSSNSSNNNNNTPLDSNENKGSRHGYRLYRGTNMEVSMPTGSLCAERNVIGSALASDLSLRREQLLAVAVLSVRLPDKKSEVGVVEGGEVGGREGVGTTGDGIGENTNGDGDAAAREGLWTRSSSEDIGISSMECHQQQHWSKASLQATNDHTGTKGQLTRYSTEDWVPCVHNENQGQVAVGAMTSIGGSSTMWSAYQLLQQPLQTVEKVNQESPVLHTASSDSIYSGNGDSSSGYNNTYPIGKTNELSSNSSDNLTAELSISSLSTSDTVTHTAGNKLLDHATSGRNSGSSTSGKFDMKDKKASPSSKSRRTIRSMITTRSVSLSEIDLVNESWSKNRFQSSKQPLSQLKENEKLNNNDDEDDVKKQLMFPMLRELLPPPAARKQGVLNIKGDSQSHNHRDNNSPGLKLAPTISPVKSNRMTGGSQSNYMTTTTIQSPVGIYSSSGGGGDDSPFPPRHDSSVTRIITVEESDMNPLRPCGACQEWLRKVAEVNPRFRVLTFTDSNCNGVIIEPVEGA